MHGGIDERARSAWGQEAGNAGERSAVGPPEAARAGMERKDFRKAGAKYSAQVHHAKTGRRKAFPFCVVELTKERAARGNRERDRGEALRGRPVGDATIGGSGKSGAWDFVRERHIKRKFD